MTTNDCPPVLRYLHELGTMPERPPVEAVLRKVADYFDASGMGLSIVNGTASHVVRAPMDTKYPDKSPWHSDAGFVKRLRTTLGALVHEDETGEWLVSHDSHP